MKSGRCPTLSCCICSGLHQTGGYGFQAPADSTCPPATPHIPCWWPVAWTTQLWQALLPRSKVNTSDRPGPASAFAAGGHSTLAKGWAFAELGPGVFQQWSKEPL